MGIYLLPVAQTFLILFNRQRLVSVQDRARAIGTFQPSAAATHCNQATVYILRELGCPLDDLVDHQGNALLADKQAQNLKTSKAWVSIPRDTAQTVGNTCSVVIAAWYNSLGHGHIATVRPENVPGDPASNGHGPLLNNIGISVGVMNENWAFGVGKDVRYYRMKGSFVL